MEKIEFKNNSEPYLSAENLNQMQDNIENAINGIGELYYYNLTKASGSLTTNGWVKIAEDFTTPVIPKGKYLLYFTATLSGKTNGIATLNPALDSSRLSANSRQTIPITSLTTSGQCIWHEEFMEDSTHTLNLYQFATVETTVSYVAVYFIRLG